MFRWILRYYLKGVKINFWFFIDTTLHFCTKIGFNLKFGNWRKCKSNCIAFTSNSSCFETIEGYITMARHENRRKCLDVCHSVHYQCVISVPCVLVDFLHHGCSIFWRKVLQMRRCRWRESPGWYSKWHVRIYFKMP